MDTDENVIEKQPKLSVVLIIENNDGLMLAQERLKHPYYGFWGRPTGKIRWGENIVTAAARELMEETGLTATMKMKGLYHKIDIRRDTGELLEDKYFCLIHGVSPQGELIVDDEGHHNEWLAEEALIRKAKVFQSVPKVTELARGAGFAYMEQHYEYDADEY